MSRTEDEEGRSLAHDCRHGFHPFRIAPKDERLLFLLGRVTFIIEFLVGNIFDAIDKAQDAFDEQKKEYEYIADLIENNQKVVQLLYGDDAYDQL